MSSNNLQYNRVYAPILISIVVVLSIFVLKPLYTEYLNKEVKIATLEKNKAEKQKSLDTLIAMQKAFISSGATNLSEKVTKLNQKFDTSKIMSTIMLNDYTRPTVLSQPRIAISNISVDKGHILPNGISLGGVSIAVSAISIDDLIDYITYLTQSTDFVFTIDNINLPIDTINSDSGDSGVSLSLALGVYYFE